MNPPINSPKNKYMSKITFSKPLKEIGSCCTAMGMSFEDAKNNALFFTEQATSNRASSMVVVYENKNQYPLFDWVETDRFYIN